MLKLGAFEKGHSRTQKRPGAARAPGRDRVREGLFSEALRLPTVVTEEGAVVLVDQPDAFLMLQLVGLLEDAPPTVPAACALFEDALNGGTVTAVEGLRAAEAARWVRAAWELGAVTIEANAERHRRGGEAQEQSRGT